MKKCISSVILGICLLGLTGCSNSVFTENFKSQFIYSVSPDGKWVIYLSNSDLHLREISSGKVYLIATNLNLSSRAVIYQPWSPNSTKIAYATPSGKQGHQIFIYDLLTKKTLVGKLASKFEWLSDDSFSIEDSEQGYIGNIADPTRLIPLPGDKNSFLVNSSPSMSQYIVEIHRDTETLYQIVDKDGNLLTNLGNDLSAVSWSKDSRYLSYSTIYPISQLWLYDAISGKKTLITESQDSITKILISPNGDLVAYLEGKTLYVSPIKGGGKKIKVSRSNTDGNVETGILDESVKWLNQDNIVYVYYSRDFLTSHTYLVKTDLMQNFSEYSITQQVPSMLWWIEKEKTLYYVDRKDKLDVLKKVIVE